MKVVRPAGAPSVFQCAADAVPGGKSGPALFPSDVQAMHRRRNPSDGGCRACRDPEMCAPAAALARTSTGVLVHPRAQLAVTSIPLASKRTSVAPFQPLTIVFCARPNLPCSATAFKAAADDKAARPRWSSPSGSRASAAAARRYLLDGSPRERTAHNTVLTRAGEEVRLIGNSHAALLEMATASDWRESAVAYVSRTTEADWARTCLRLLRVGETGLTLDELGRLQEIYPGGKRKHFQRIHDATGVPFSDMVRLRAPGAGRRLNATMAKRGRPLSDKFKANTRLETLVMHSWPVRVLSVCNVRPPSSHGAQLFFDNEYRNCADVKKLGVTCIYTPHGTRAFWCLSRFSSVSRRVPLHAPRSTPFLVSDAWSAMHLRAC